jgi:hypothetical protein
MRESDYSESTALEERVGTSAMWEVLVGQDHAPESAIRPAKPKVATG